MYLLLMRHTSKIRGIKTYIWFIMDAAKRSVIGYQVSDNRGVGPCILAMRMAFQHLKELPKNFKFIADGYSAYPLPPSSSSMNSVISLSLKSHK